MKILAIGMCICALGASQEQTQSLKDFAKPFSVRGRIAKFIPRPLFVEQMRFKAGDCRQGPADNQSNIYAELSPQTTQARMAALRRSYHRVDHGSFADQFAYAFKARLLQEGEYHTASLALQQATPSAGNYGYAAMFNYRRDHDPASVVWRQALNSVKRAEVNQFKSYALRIIFRKKTK